MGWVDARGDGKGIGNGKRSTKIRAQGSFSREWRLGRFCKNYDNERVV